MSDLFRLIWGALIGLFRPRAALEAEILVLRHQLNVLRRKSSKRVALSTIDRLLLVGLYRLAPGAGRSENYKTGDAAALAPCRLSNLLALEIPTAPWPAKYTSGHSPPNSRDECRQPALRCSEGFFSKLARSVLRHIRVSSKQELKERLMAAVDYFNCDPIVHTWTYKLDKAA
jgi:hypothetical protein